MTLGTNVDTNGGFIKISSNTRKDAFSLLWTILITGTAEANNPPNADKNETTLILPVNIIIPNLGAPTLKSNPTDVRI
jgi:hypothetical protein